MIEEYTIGKKSKNKRPKKSSFLNREMCTVFKGQYYFPWFWNINKITVFRVPEKVIVFDLDETLGCFGDLFILWSGIKNICPHFERFDELFDLYPEFLRYGIITILEYLYKKKIQKECHKLVVYTNNQCTGDWVKHVTKYIEQRVHTQFSEQQDKSKKHEKHETLFDQLICAFRINNQPIEIKRTTHRKTMSDLLSCTLLMRDVEICFVDDVEHNEMKTSRVYYICPLPYYHNLTAEQIVNRFINSELFSSIRWKNTLLFSKDFWVSWFSSYKRAFKHKRMSYSNLRDDLIVSKNLMTHLQQFIQWKRIPPKYDSTKKGKTQKKCNNIQKKQKTKKRPLQT
jgi:hypothetical protein|tara:strand:- start:416 stop:1438 length:1023 start_codon:yes stop_codon:yes gene_type:complete